MYSTGDPEFDKVAVGVGTDLVKAAIKAAWSGVSSLPDWVKRKYTEGDPFGLEAKRYSEGIERRYNNMKIIGMVRPVPIRNILVRVNILAKIPSRSSASVDELSSDYVTDDGFGTTIATKDGLDAVDKDARLAVLGKPGSGKTTFLKSIALAANGGKLKGNYLPVFIGMKSWSDGGETIRETINNEFNLCGFEESKAFVDRLLDNGSLILLLDALDEIDDDIRAKSALREIRELSEKYPKIKVIISCRTAAYAYLFEHFTDVELADFKPEQVAQFVKNWFADQPKKAELCLSEIARERNRSLRDLCRTPLLLTLMCILFDEGMAFPTNRAELYGGALEALLKKWDATRGIRRSTSYGQLSLKKKELMLGEIAKKHFEQGEIFFKQEDLAKQIRTFMGNLKPSANGFDIDIDPVDVLKEIEAQHGILVERASRIYSFSHLTFQEYFTAKTITDSTDKTETKKLMEHALDSRWREIFILTTGLLSRADDFVVELRCRCSGLSRAEPAIPDLLNRTAALVHAAGGIPLPLRRALALAHVVERLAQQERWYRSSVEACRELVEDMQSEFGRIKQIDLATLQTLKIGLNDSRDRVQDLVAHALNSYRGFGLERFDQYIKLTRLMVNCLNVDAVINHKVRERLVASILTEQ